MSDITSWTTSAAGNNATPPNGFPEGQAPSTVNDSAREQMAAVRRWYNDTSGVNTTAGTGNAYTLAASQTITAYAAGNAFMFIADRANTGAATLSVDGLAAKSLKKNFNLELAANDIKAGQLVVAAYHAATDTFQMLSLPGREQFEIIDAAGDLIVGTAADTPARLAVGANGTVLTADSAAAGGVAWAASGFTTGDAKPTFKTVADVGWVMADDASIGNAASGATNRANADTEALFTLLWNNVINTWAPVSGGRGASAAADFAANKTLTLPKALGRALAVAGAGSGLTSRALGENLGAETHTLTIAEMPSHQHEQTANQFENNVVGTTSMSNQVSTQSGGFTKFTGGGGAHNNMPPEFFMNVMIKL